MARVYKRGEVWWADVRTPGGERVRRSTRCRDRGAALRIAREWERGAEHEAADEAAGIEKPSGVTLADLARQYTIDLRDRVRAGDRSESYLRGAARHLKLYILPYFDPDTVAATITRAGVEGFIRQCLSGTVGASETGRRRACEVPKTSTVNRVINTLRRLLNHGVRTGQLRENPARNLEPLKERPEEIFRALSQSEIDAWFAELSDEPLRLVTWLLETGMRITEATTLQRADIDRPNRTALVSSKRSKSGRLRRVPLSKVALAVLDEIGDGPGLVFGPRLHREALRAAWVRTKLQGRAPTPHDLRATFASRSLQRGLTPLELRDVMGHKALATTQKYVHAFGGVLEAIAEKLDRGAAPPRRLRLVRRGAR